MVSSVLIAYMLQALITRLYVMELFHPHILIYVLMYQGFYQYTH